MAKELVKSTVSAIVADAFSELQSLGEELRSWHDNLPESLQEHRSDVSDAADTLENLSEVDIPTIVSELEVEYAPLVGRRTGRSARGSQATYELGAAVEVMQEWLESNPTHPQHGEVETAIDEVQGLIDEADGVGYPGMYA